MNNLISKSYPVTHLLNPLKEYVRSEHTNIRIRFEQVRAEMAKQERKQVRRVK